jgi:hypothetical protein
MLARRVATSSLSCSAAVNCSAAVVIVVIRKSGSTMPLACIADISKNELVTSLHCDEIKEQKTEIKVSNFYRSTTK